MEKEKLKSMEEKLREDYKISIETNNKGHAIGFYNEMDEIIKSFYDFPEGKFTIRKTGAGGFFWWNYDAKQDATKEKDI